jgi:selenium donor protein
MSTRPIYLDYNATTPIDPEVAAEMMPWLQGRFGNPSSAHAFGLEAREAVVLARARVARLIGCAPDEIVFTSGGTEANNTVIKGVASLLRPKGGRILISAVEHPAIVEPCEALAREGFRIGIIPVDSEGLVDPLDVASAITPDTILISVMHANNEVGSIQPIAEIGRIARERGILFHTDAAQTAGKIPVDAGAMKVDFLTIAGHKLYGPTGTGALFVRRGCEVPSLIHGADHERGRRAGTENVLELVGLGKACEVAAGRLERDMEHSRAMRDRLWSGLSAAGLETRRNGSAQHALPNTLSVSFRGVDAATLLAEIGDVVAASAGAACHGADVSMSTTLKAMEVPEEWAMGTVRLSTGRSTTEEEIDRTIAAVAGAVRGLQPEGGAPGPAAPDGEPAEIRLTRYTKGMGCACKLRPADLERILRVLPVPDDPRVLVGLAGSDDAAVYRLSDDLAIVQTVDFFTPIVDDPWHFGAVAAANALSDIYAMGAKPLFALNIVAFPTARLPLAALERILQGAAEKAREAGVSILGGHSVEDTEPKFGMAVTGTVHPDRILTNAGARPGDRLILTKPLGTGIIATALKHGAATASSGRRALQVMERLNASAASAMTGAAVTACTDVTGFGLLGHLRGLIAASGVDVLLDPAEVPFIGGVLDLAAAGHVPGGSEANLAHVAPWMSWSPGIGDSMKLALADAQTSGGLLIAVSAGEAGTLLERIRKGGDGEARIIGFCEAEGPGAIRC